MTRPTVIITGGAGLLGTAVREKLRLDYELWSVDENEMVPLAFGEEIETCFRFDLGDPTQALRWWELCEPAKSRLAGIIHLAAYYDFTNLPNTKYQALEVFLKKLLVDFGRECPPRSKFLFSSSMAALAPVSPGTKIQNYGRKLGAWQYPISKIRAENILDHSEIFQPIVQLVLAGVYTDFCELVPLFQTIKLVQSRSPEKYFYPADPARGLTYVHVDEVVEAFRCALVMKLGRRVRLLIGQPNPVTYQKIHETIAENFYGRKIPLIAIPKWMAKWGAAVICLIFKCLGIRHFIQPWMIPFAGEHFEFDLSETKTVLGWSPTRYLAEDLKAILEKAKNEPVEWERKNNLRPW
jgi:nucleoside-diphosphate-sugar epimerase